MKHVEEKQKDFYRLYKIVHYLTMTNLEIESINKNRIDPIIYNTIGSVYNRNQRLIKELKSKINNFDSIFEDISNEKIFCMMTMIDKMILLSELQALEFEQSLEIEIK